MSGRSAVAVGARSVSTADRPKLRETLVAWSFALPFLILFLLFMAGPIAASLVMSFTDIGLRDIRDPFSVSFAGFQNYLALLDDGVFLKAAQNTFVFVVVGIPLTMLLGLAAAVALNQAVVRFKTFFRVGFYLPVVTSIVAIAVVWRLLLGADTGLINGLLSTIGITGPGWLVDERYALWSLVVMAAWRGLGNLMIIFLAGLQTISGDLYEAAEMDGATRWERFRFITLPMLQPTLLFGAVITSIGFLQFFEEPFVMTDGGPLNSTISVAFHAYKQFSFGNYGYTAAISYVLFLAIALLTLVQFRLFRTQT